MACIMVSAAMPDAVTTVEEPGTDDMAQCPSGDGPPLHRGSERPGGQGG